MKIIDLPLFSIADACGFNVFEVSDEQFHRCHLSWCWHSFTAVFMPSRAAATAEGVSEHILRCVRISPGTE